MGVAIDVAGTKDKTAAELEGVRTKPANAESLLPVAGGPRPFPGFGVVAAEEMKQRGFSQAGGAIRLPLLVDQEREGDAGFLAEEAGILPVTEPDGSETRSLFLEGLLVLAQLRDVLAAEDSAIVAEEDQDRRALSPQRAEPERAAFRVGQDDTRELRAE